MAYFGADRTFILNSGCVQYMYFFAHQLQLPGTAAFNYGFDVRVKNAVRQKLGAHQLNSCNASLGSLSYSMFQRPLPPVLTDDGTSLTVVARYPWAGCAVVTKEWWTNTNTAVTSIIHFYLHSIYIDDLLRSLSWWHCLMAPLASCAASVDTPIPSPYATDSRSFQLPITVPWHHGSNLPPIGQNSVSLSTGDKKKTNSRSAGAPLLRMDGVADR